MIEVKYSYVVMFNALNIKNYLAYLQQVALNNFIVKQDINVFIWRVCMTINNFSESESCP